MKCLQEMIHGHYGSTEIQQDIISGLCLELNALPSFLSDAIYIKPCPKAIFKQDLVFKGTWQYTTAIETLLKTLQVQTGANFAFIRVNPAIELQNGSVEPARYQLFNLIDMTWRSEPINIVEDRKAIRMYYAEVAASWSMHTDLFEIIEKLQQTVDTKIHLPELLKCDYIWAVKQHAIPPKPVDVTIPDEAWDDAVVYAGKKRG